MFLISVRVVSLFLGELSMVCYFCSHPKFIFYFSFAIYVIVT